MTMVTGTEEVQMEQYVSKSTFKAKALELCRQVESTGKELVITDHGKPVLKVIPYRHDPAEALKALRGSVLRYEDPLEPVGVEDWEALR
jgi:prevent-host-death family protein